ncbi:hypothetical protein J5N97_003427 [Dioscorea zingiberensis]|uniref:Uncharacterized protein n=1 Tax=Dioscorea zingiberensis TaxID=325984 RepID=A0A9D5D470_9LILI|nr:hypothetical protein J5N97_003427 [Dioscorea zingiberensis]
MSADVQLLILSGVKSNILPADLVLPFCPIAVNSDVNASPEELQSWRWYLDTLRSLPYSSQPDLHQILQDELVAAMREDRSLRPEQLNSGSCKPARSWMRSRGRWSDVESEIRMA